MAAWEVESETPAPKGGGSAASAWEVESEAPDARKALPLDVRPSVAGGGRGFVNPTIAAKLPAQKGALAAAAAPDMDPMTGIQPIEAPDYGGTVTADPLSKPYTRDGLEEWQRAGNFASVAPARQQTIRDTSAYIARRDSAPSATVDQAGLDKDAQVAAKAAEPTGLGSIPYQAGDTALDAARGAVKVAPHLAKNAWDALRMAGDAVGAESFAKFAALSSQEGDSYLKRFDNPNGDHIMTNAVESLGTAVFGSAFGGSTGAIALGSGQSAADKYSEARNSGFSVGDATEASVVYGIAEALGEKLSIPSLGRMVWQNGISRGLQPTEALKEALKQQGGEQLTQAIEDLYDKVGSAGGKPNMSWEDYLQDVVDVAKTTALMSGIAHGTGKVTAAMQQKAFQAGLQQLAEQRRTDAYLTPGLDLQQQRNTLDAGQQLVPDQTVMPTSNGIISTEPAPRTHVSMGLPIIQTHDMPTTALTPAALAQIAAHPAVQAAKASEAAAQVAPTDAQIEPIETVGGEEKTDTTAPNPVPGAPAIGVAAVPQGSLAAAAEARLKGEQDGGLGAARLAVGAGAPLADASRSVDGGRGVRSQPDQPASAVLPVAEGAPGDRSQAARVAPEAGGRSAPLTETSEPADIAKATTGSIASLKEPFKTAGAAVAYAAQQGLRDFVPEAHPDGGFVLVPKPQQPTAKDFDEQQRKLEDINAAWAGSGLRADDGSPKRVVVSRAPLSPVVAGVRTLLRALGTDLIVADGIERGVSYHGVAVVSRELAENAPELALAVTLHEVGHTLEQANPELHAELANQVTPLLKPGAVDEQLKFENENLLPGEKPMSREGALREVLSNIQSGAMLRPEFWDHLYDVDKNLFRRALYVFAKTATRIAHALSSSGSEYDLKTYTDHVDRVTRVAAEVWNKRRETRRKPEVNESVARTIQHVTSGKVTKDVGQDLLSRFDKAATAKRVFDKHVRNIQEAVNPSRSPLLPKALKGVERAAEKAITEYKGDAFRLKDVNRATIVVDTPAQAAAAIAKAREEFGELHGLRDHLSPGTGPLDASGYRDVKFNVKAGGDDVEVQINMPSMLEAKEKAHALYEQRRSLPEQGGPEAKALDSQMAALYAGAAKKSGIEAPAAPTETSTPKRKTGESDKAYAKRAIDPGPDVKSLPEEPAKYFRMKGARLVNIVNLVSTKTEGENAQGAANGPKRMKAAGEGLLSKRDPIDVEAIGDTGFYRVVDGNGTLASAKALGWKQLPVKVRVVEDESEAPESQPQLARAKKLTPEQEQAAVKVALNLPQKQTTTSAIEIKRGPKLEGAVAGNVDRVGLYFDRIAKAAGGPFDFTKPEDMKRALKIATAEVKFQLAQENSGLDWYNSDIGKAFEITSRFFPELKDETQRQLFTVFAALQSPGTVADLNWQVAAEAWQHYKATGTVPPRNPANGKLWVGGTTAVNKAKSLSMLDALLKAKGEAEAVKWLFSTHTVKELNDARREFGKMGPGVSGKMSDTALGLAAFGPKVGPFAMNINGLKETTVDVWATRTFNRWMGTMLGPDGHMIDGPTEPQRRAIKEIFNEAGKQTGLDSHEVQSVLWFFEQRLFAHLGTGARSLKFSDGAQRFADRQGDAGSQRVLADVRRADVAAQGNASAGSGAAERGRAGGESGSQPLDSRPKQSTRGTSLDGLPADVRVDGELIHFGGFKPAQEAARKYAKAAGLEYKPPTAYAKVDPERAKRIADAFETLRDAPEDPEVKRAYDAMIDETIAQYQAMLDTGLKVELITGEDPYGNPRNAILDVTRNNHLWVYPTDLGFGSNTDVDVGRNPLLRKTGIMISGKEAVANDIFRAVHDYFGHIKEGVGFRADGEENAWRSHATMYSPLARRAMTTETRGQNSWLNFGPHGESNRTASPTETVYADQKVGLLPEWATTEGAPQMSRAPKDPFAPGYRALDGRMIDVPVLVQSTGRTMHITVDAGAELRALDARADTFRKLISCLA